MSPPITTVASGLCTSAPVPVAMAIGTKPSEATNAVIKTGRRRVSAPSWMAASFGRPSRRSCSDETEHHEAVENRDTGQGDKADGGGNRKRHAPRRQRCDAARERERNRAEDKKGVARRLQRTEQEQKNQYETGRYDKHQPFARRGEIFELAAPHNPVACRKPHLLCQAGLRARRQ